MKARILDQFYTKNKVATECLDFLFKTIEENFLNKENYFFLEPSAGTGSFFNLLDKNNRMGSDLEPKTSDIILQDFLLFNDLVLNKDKSIITIGNPPFGKNSSLAIKFFNKASNFSDIIAFIVPKTFKKDSVKNKLNLNFWLLKEKDLDKNSFVFNNDEYDVPCVFQIWVKKEEKRNKKSLNIEYKDLFCFVSKEEADFAIQRVGANAGRVKVDFEKYAKASHYFLKSSLEIRKVFEEICWKDVKFNTAGNPSISKKELVELFFKFYRKEF